MSDFHENGKDKSNFAAWYDITNFIPFRKKRALKIAVYLQSFLNLSETLANVRKWLLHVELPTTDLKNIYGKIFKMFLDFCESNL